VKFGKAAGSPLSGKVAEPAVLAMNVLNLPINWEGTRAPGEYEF
jgi:hypothetical protein